MPKPTRPHLLVTGASGLLGRCITRRALDSPRAVEVSAGYCSAPGRVRRGRPVHLDFVARDDVEARIHELEPTAVIHTAAINPGGDGNRMMEVNIGGAERVARAAASLGARLVHVSTDVVHDGRNAPYSDAAPPSPTDDYGRSKAEAERAVLAACPRAVIVRTSLIYGLEEMDRGTAGFAARLAAGQPVRLFGDVLRQPIWVETLAEALLRLAIDAVGTAGHLNLAGAQVMSRDAFGRRMLEWWDVPGRERVETICAAGLSTSPPLDLRLDTSTAAQLLAIPLPGVETVLNNAASRVRSPH